MVFGAVSVIKISMEVAMPLIDCPECSRQISTAAESCPQCGHPMRGRQSAGPPCYACSATATTRCQSCGMLSCAQHLQNISYELRCGSCYSNAIDSKVIGFVFGAVVLIGVLIAMASNGIGPFGR